MQPFFNLKDSQFNGEAKKYKKGLLQNYDKVSDVADYQLMFVGLNTFDITFSLSIDAH